MLRRTFLSSLAGAVVAMPQLRPRPNVVFILLDDMGWRDLGCYGNRYHETPHFDSVAAAGARFTQAYAACPVCSPTRASIMTGKYPARLGVTDWIPGRKQWPAARVLTPPNGLQLPLREVTFAEQLKKMGYRTASIGKWHLGGAGFLPTDQGFDRNIAGTNQGSPPSYFGPFELPNLRAASPEESLTEMLTEAAVSFIEENAGAPFCLYLSHFTPHIPLQAREKTIAKYRDKPNRESDPVYAAMIESADDSVGRVMEALERKGLADNTLLIITSDNGGLRYEGGRKEWVTTNAPLRAGKGHIYEGGIRESLLIRWPAVAPPATVIDTPVSSVDFFPTICAAAGTRPASPIDGQNLLPLLRGARMAPRPLFWHYPHYSNQGGAPAGAVRDGDWKYIRFYEDGRGELYHLREDPGEQLNLVRKQPLVAGRLSNLLDTWLRAVNAAMPQPNPHYDPEKADQGLTGAEAPTPPAA